MNASHPHPGRIKNPENVTKPLQRPYHLPEEEVAWSKLLLRILDCTPTDCASLGRVTCDSEDIEKGKLAWRSAIGYLHICRRKAECHLPLWSRGWAPISSVDRHSSKRLSSHWRRSKHHMGLEGPHHWYLFMNCHVVRLMVVCDTDPLESDVRKCEQLRTPVPSQVLSKTCPLRRCLCCLTAHWGVCLYLCHRHILWIQQT